MTVLSRLAKAIIGGVSPVRGSFETYCWCGATASNRVEIGIVGRYYKASILVRLAGLPGVSRLKALSPPWRAGLTKRSAIRHKRSSRAPGHADHNSITPITV
jgi:hypothetical protein